MIRIDHADLPAGLRALATPAHGGVHLVLSGSLGSRESSAATRLALRAARRQGWLGSRALAWLPIAAVAGAAAWLRAGALAHARGLAASGAGIAGAGLVAAAVAAAPPGTWPGRPGLEQRMVPPAISATHTARPRRSGEVPRYALPAETAPASHPVMPSPHLRRSLRSAAPSPSASTAPAPGAVPSPSPSPSGTQPVCVVLGPLGVCVSLGVLLGQQ